MALADVQLRQTAQIALVHALKLITEAEIAFERTPDDGVYMCEFDSNLRSGVSSAEHPHWKVIVAISEQEELLEKLFLPIQGGQSKL